MSLGIEKTKMFIKAGFNLGEEAAEGLKDKKLTFFESIGLLPEVFDLVKAVKSWPEVKEELSDGVTDEEKAELKEWAENEFDIPNDKVEVVIEKSILAVVTLIELAYEIMRIREDQE